MRGVQIKTADEVRVFAHDAKSVTPSDTVDLDDVDGRGACIYIGDVSGGSDIKVTMESGTPATFKGIAAGSFLPILVTAVTAATGAAALADSDILGLY